jgi:release factor glutamine methyltransferase
MTANEALRLAIPRLRAGGVEDAALDARLLMAHALGIAQDRLTLHLAEAMTASQGVAYEAAITARLARQPVAQIIGQRQFWGLSFCVTRDTLDPRPDTETLVAEAVKAPFQTLLDLGTGTGCVLLSCLHANPQARGLGVDLSPEALAVAEGNAQSLGLASRAKFQPSDWFSTVTGRYDLIVSNPPYIAADEMPTLAPEVRDWEPHLALTPGGDGLTPYRIIAREAPRHLTGQGRLLVETGPTQGQAVSALFAAAGLHNIRILPDMDGRDRVVAATMA